MATLYIYIHYSIVTHSFVEKLNMLLMYKNYRSPYTRFSANNLNQTTVISLAFVLVVPNLR